MSKNPDHIIITGGAGFIGSHLARRCLQEGARVTVLDDLSTGYKNNIPAPADLIQIDLSREEEYKKLNGLKASAIFHLGGQSSGEASFLDPVKDLGSHVLSTLFLCQWARENKVPRFLYASSMAVYGDAPKLPVSEGDPIAPKTFYAAAKASAENYVRLYQSLGLQTTIFRLFSVYGPGQNFQNKLQGMISIYLSYMLEGQPVIVKGSKDRFRDFVFISDVVDAWMSAYGDPVSFGKTYNIASEKRTTVEEVIRTLKEEFNDKSYPVRFQEGTPGDQFGMVGSSALIQGDLGWNAKVGLKTGISAMIDQAKNGVKHG